MLAIKRIPLVTALLALVVVIAAAILMAGAVPGLLSGASAATQNKAQAAIAASCTVSYGALDPTDQTKVNPNKLDPSDHTLVPGAVGVPVTQRDIPGIKAELQERRTCGTDGKFDPELTATQYADWSAAGLTSRKVAFADIDAFRAQMIADPSLYGDVLNELQGLENAPTTTTSIQQNVPAGVWSVYVLPDGKGNLTTHIGTSSHVGTAIVFTHGSAVIKYRLECGFQILRETPPAGMQVCTFAECGPPPPPVVHVPTCQELGNCHVPTCQDTGTCSTPSCPPGWHGTYPVCKDPASDDPAAQGNAPVGGGHNAGSGPGTLKPAPAQPPAAPRVNPPAPAPAPAPPVKVTTPSTPAPTVNTGDQSNNGTVPTTGSGASCNPTFQSC